MWQIVFLSSGVIALSGAIYLISRIRRFEFLERIAKKSRLLSWFLAALIMTGLGFVLYKALNLPAMVVVILHLIFIWLICDITAIIVGKVRKTKLRASRAGIAAITITVLYLGAGWYCAHHVRQTNYSFTTSKDLGRESLRVVYLADSHLGITLDGEDFARQTERIQETNPDIVVIVGDFVDDDTDKDDMLAACRALGELKTTHGVYFVFGNHDVGYYDYRNFTSQELRTALIENNVMILEDDAVLIDNSFYLIGRKDRSVPGRMSAEALTSVLDNAKYMIMFDHQPNDYAAEASSGADLVLSGHTHGGHMFPSGYIGLIMGANDSLYGTERRGDTDFVVTSGISGWAVPFKTGTMSEYVVIDILSGR